MLSRTGMRTETMTTLPRTTARIRLWLAGAAATDRSDLAQAHAGDDEAMSWGSGAAMRRTPDSGARSTPAKPSRAEDQRIRALCRPADAAPRRVARDQAGAARWKVLFFREQRIDAEQHLAFRGVRRPRSTTPPEGGSPEIVRFERNDPQARKVGTENGWHSDADGASRPLARSAREVPERGGDTVWADMGRA